MTPKKRPNSFFSDRYLLPVAVLLIGYWSPIVALSIAIGYLLTAALANVGHVATLRWLIPSVLPEAFTLALLTYIESRYPHVFPALSALVLLVRVTLMCRKVHYRLGVDAVESLVDRGVWLFCRRTQTDGLMRLHKVTTVRGVGTTKPVSNREAAVQVKPFVFCWIITK